MNLGKLFKPSGTSLAAQQRLRWLRLHASATEDMDSIPGWGAKSLHALMCGGRKKKIKVQMKTRDPSEPKFPNIGSC